MRRTGPSEPMRRLVLTSIFLSVSFAPLSALADDVTDRASSAPLPKAAAGAAATGDQKMKLNEVEIHGELEKPKIFFILPKAKRDAQAKQRQFRFYPDILEPLDKDRFEEEARVLYQHGIPAE